MKLAWIATAVLILPLAGCVSERQAIADETQQARDHCLSEGKQFVLRKTSISDRDAAGLVKNIQVEGVCLGPDDPGYVEPVVSMSAH